MLFGEYQQWNLWDLAGNQAESRRFPRILLSGSGNHAGGGGFDEHREVYCKIEEELCEMAFNSSFGLPPNLQELVALSEWGIVWYLSRPSLLIVIVVEGFLKDRIG